MLLPHFNRISELKARIEGEKHQAPMPVDDTLPEGQRRDENGVIWQVRGRGEVACVAHVFILTVAAGG